MKLGHDRIALLIANQLCTHIGFLNVFHRHSSDPYSRPLSMGGLNHPQIDICESGVQKQFLAVAD